MALADYLPADPDSRIARELARACRRYLHRFNGYSYDFVEGGEQNIMQRLAPFAFQTIFDVGANTGEWTMLARTYFPQAVFHTFEIAENTFSLLVNKLSGSCFRNNNFGLSSKIGQVPYKDYGPASGLNTLIEKTSVFDSSTRPESRLAEVTTGDHYCEGCTIAFIDWLKVDVEGAEHLVFSGFENLFKKKAVRVVQFEYGFNNGDAGFLMRDFFEFFNDYGYLLAKIRKRRIEFTGFHHAMNNFESGPNYLGIRQEDQAVYQALTQ